MEHAEWMNAEVREEIEDLQRTHGFEEREAVAFWHLRQAGKLMNDMRHADVLEEIDRQERRGDQEAVEPVLGLIHDISVWHSRVSQHLTALYRELGVRVLRRAYPDGWGRVHKAGDEEEG